MIKCKEVPSGLRVGVLFNSPVRPSKGEEVDYVADAEVVEEVEAVEEALDKLGLKHQHFALEDEFEGIITALKKYGTDVVINLCEAAFGESHLEMAVPSLLEFFRIPYTGSPPLAIGLCQNKGLTKNILRDKGIPTPESRVLNRFEEWRGELGYPLFVKPLSEDGSIGITRDSYVRDELELKRQVNYIVERYRQPALVEKYIGGRELNVSVLGNGEARVLPVSEIVFKFSYEPKIVDYRAKWFEESEEYKATVPECPAKLESSMRSLVEKEALEAYEALYCRDYARVDIRLEGEVQYVLEVNPNPDISYDGGFVRSLKASGTQYEEFIREIIYSALHRKLT